ncbi:transcription termination/antitermination NusG family protein [Neotabrizicola sp. sgz301269]|uniref:transcription termination/antitermination NusG family protein n=1 Tax=Neotabrizicola sp. sgz301269 TaxID=3276282 RepID=UPI00376F85A0
MSYYIGQILPPVITRGAVGDLMPEPLWFAFTTPPQKERAALAWLERREIEAWYPTQTKYRTVPRAKVKRQKYEAVVVPRYIFARFTGYPQWDILRTCKHLSGVVSYEDHPAPISDTTLMQMAAVPQRLEEIRERETERRRIRPGDKAKVKDGPLEGWLVDVQTVHAGLASFIVPLLGERETHISVDRLSRIPPLA